MTDFPTFSYTSTCEILLWSLPIQIILGVPPAGGRGKTSIISKSSATLFSNGLQSLAGFQFWFLYLQPLEMGGFMKRWFTVYGAGGGGLEGKSGMNI